MHHVIALVCFKPLENVFNKLRHYCYFADFAVFAFESASYELMNL